jgi:hypothetical protein
MDNDPFTIRIFVVDGDPEGIRVVDKLNWTGVGVVFPRERWQTARTRGEFKRTGVYILVGYREGDEDLPTIYIGEGDAITDRIEKHAQDKEFWEYCYAFTTSNNGLNKTHARWLERELIQQAKRVGQSRLDNGTSPPEPFLSEAERADSRSFLREILQVLPIMGLRAFEEPRAVAMPRAPVATSDSLGVKTDTTSSGSPNDVVVVVPAQEDGFRAVFLGESRWRSIRISGGKIQQIRYVAAYQTRPVSAITHYAPVASIESYGEAGKFQLIFSGPAVEIGPIPFGDAPIGFMQGPRYTTLGKLKVAKKLMDLF